MSDGEGTNAYGDLAPSPASTRTVGSGGVDTSEARAAVAAGRAAVAAERVTGVSAPDGLTIGSIRARVVAVRRANEDGEGLKALHLRHDLLRDVCAAVAGGTPESAPNLRAMCREALASCAVEIVRIRPY